MKKLSYLLLTITLLLTMAALTSAQEPDPALAKRVPAATVSASLLDYTQNEDYTGNVSLPIKLLTIGDEEVELKYYSQGVSEKVRTDNQYAPSGEVGLGWQLLYGSISGEINGSADTSDDVYYYNGADGSFQLQEGADGVFRIPNYKAWKFQRQVNSNGIITGWIVTKDDGTILRFGDYDGTNFDTNFTGPTYATRYFLGENGLVSDGPLMGDASFEEIPYEWDLSNIQNIRGNTTTLTYQQITYSTGLASPTPPVYTRESHLYQISDNQGQQARFYYDTKTPYEYYDDYASYDQHLVDTKYLSSIQFFGNGTMYKQIELTSDTSSVENGIVKRYLTGFQIEDKSGASLPPYSFTYYGVGNSSRCNPGALESASDQDGGRILYTYKPQSLPNFALSGCIPEE